MNAPILTTSTQRNYTPNSSLRHLLDGGVRHEDLLMNSRLSVRVFLLFCALTSSCKNNAPASPSANRQPPLSEHKVLASSNRELAFGGDCGAVGSAGCATGLCLKTGPKRNEGYRCSKSCATDQDCRDGWACSQVYPSAAGFFCVPAAEGGIDPSADGERLR